MKRFGFISFWVLLISALILPSFAVAGLVSGPGWQVVGSADFNGDGSKDILWRNQATGDMAVWYMLGGALLREQPIEKSPGSAWRVAGVADFNGDGSPDILLRNESTGDLRIWYLNGPVVVGQDAVARVGPGWDVVGVGDFNNDGRPDILLRNSATGESVVWYMNGALRLGVETLETLPPPWDVIEVSDFDLDGSPDILWKNAATGEVVTWYMRGLVHVDPGVLAVSASSIDASKACTLSSNVHPAVSRDHIAVLADPCSNFTTGMPHGAIVSSTCIRAPPI
jgi:hypothetical protein